jgi:predicted ArsR family transcriptional regulator
MTTDQTARVIVPEHRAVVHRFLTEHGPAGHRSIAAALGITAPAALARLIALHESGHAMVVPPDSYAQRRDGGESHRDTTLWRAL